MSKSKQENPECVHSNLPYIILFFHRRPRIKFTVGGGCFQLEPSACTWDGKMIGFKLYTKDVVIDSSNDQPL